MPLEDELSDIIKKARAGLAMSVSDLSRRTGVSNADLQAIEKGGRPADHVQLGLVAGGLGLGGNALSRIVFDHWEPAVPKPPAWIETVYGSIGGYGVQGYIVHDNGEALIIDTAYNAPAMIETLKARGLRLVGICLTHGHADHAEGIDRILDYQEAPVLLGSDDHDLLSWKPAARLMSSPPDGRVVQVGRKTIRCMATPGHTPGGICYVISDQQDPLCFVGDTLFAGSIGRSNPATLYEVHLESVRKRVLTLPVGYRLLPGHGPATTVQEELEHNPFA
ncbi:putative Hydrolase with N-terminal DNA-binding domain [Nitrospira sp. KM1]|uniref:MBL fold metallo-hydrolase n=1 Tax=Nitrospira sp. KM1 TaxID=1936990 RepID=UPI0013A7311E|nr:MBL fold metallo-hydrolase [Nitrospira sp. KM1]BCA55131.1 putative Hydrolase with N-terminal DNA-binding domain [Nitrospira sp. KM1]